METVLNVLHVASAVFLVGPMAILPMVALRDLRLGHGAQLATLTRSTRVFSLASLIVAVFGFGLLGMSDPKFNLSIGTPWVLISLIVYLAALVLSLAVVVPSLSRASELAGDTPTGGGGKDYQRIAMGSGVVTLLLVVVVVLMVWKP